jgi:glyoxylate/hydroxypyruvate reductase A
VVQYIILRVLCPQRHVAEYMSQQARKIWNPIAPRKVSETRIVVLGAGRIGGWAAKLFAELGYDTAVWSRHQKLADLCGQVARGEPLSNKIDLELGY